MRLPELYTKAKEDLQRLTLIDRKNEVAEQKLSETVKNYYRVRLLAKHEDEEARKEVAETNVPLKMSDQAVKKAARQTQAMENIMKQYRVEEVAKAANEKIENDLLTGELPKTRT